MSQEKENLSEGKMEPNGKEREMVVREYSQDVIDECLATMD